jgi:hypothetical protein
VRACGVAVNACRMSLEGAAYQEVS